MADSVKKATTKAKSTDKGATSSKPRKKAATGNGHAAAASNGSRAKAMRYATKSGMTVSDQQVAELAHRFWNERGRQHGHHEEDWLRAEQALRASAP